MNLNKLTFVALALLPYIVATFSSSSGEKLLPDPNDITIRSNGVHVLKYENELPQTRTSARLLAQKPRVIRTCDKYPRICVAKGSPGPDCCHKQCVNVMVDGFNCGFCGKKCKYQEICCNGLCVNPLFDEKNCGECNNKCKNGSSCVYGMCSYA